MEVFARLAARPVGILGPSLGRVHLFGNMDSDDAIAAYPRPSMKVSRDLLPPLGSARVERKETTRKSWRPRVRQALFPISGARLIPASHDLELPIDCGSQASA